MQQQQKNFIDYSLFSEAVSNLPRKSPLLINTINQYSYCLADRDNRFKISLQESDVLLPDGISIVAAVRFLTGQKIKKIAGSDIHHYLLNDLNKKNGKCFYLGSSKDTLEKIEEKLAIEYPNVIVKTFAPPYKTTFDLVDDTQMILEINEFKPDVLFIGMTAPKQEKWAHAYRNDIKAKVICTIGAVFDFYAGTVERPRNLWISIGLEWFVRLVKEPKRLWVRYLYYGPVFVLLIIKEKLRLLLSRRHSSNHRVV